LIHPDTKAGDLLRYRPSGRIAAKFMAENLKGRAISIISINNDYGASLLEGFKEHAKSG
jgi:hypothetical protein